MVYSVCNTLHIETEPISQSTHTCVRQHKQKHSHRPPVTVMLIKPYNFKDVYSMGSRVYSYRMHSPNNIYIYGMIT